MVLHLLNRHRANFFRDKAHQAFVKREPQSSDALRAQTHRRGHHQIGAIRFEKVRRAHVCFETLGD